MDTSHSPADSPGPKSFLLPIMATAVAAGLVRMLLRKRKDDRAAAEARSARPAPAGRPGRRG